MRAVKYRMGLRTQNSLYTERVSNFFFFFPQITWLTARVLIKLSICLLVNRREKFTKHALVSFFFTTANFVSARYRKRRSENLMWINQLEIAVVPCHLDVAFPTKFPIFYLTTLRRRLSNSRWSVWLRMTRKPICRRRPQHHRLNHVEHFTLFYSSLRWIEKNHRSNFFFFPSIMLKPSLKKFWNILRPILSVTIQC